MVITKKRGSNFITTKPEEIQTRRLFMFFLYGIIPLVLAILTELIGKEEKNWFTKSNNPINQIFAKNAWGWASLIFFSLNLIQYSQNKFQKTMLLKWLAATVYWVLLTQRIYSGTSFRDQVFLFTGGKCTISNIKNVLDCKTLGTSTLENGHLISGHCLLLIHASLFLWEEFGRLLYHPTRRTFNLNQNTTLSTSQTIQKYIIYTARSILTVFLWLLMITSVYFHTLLEKITGIFFGFLFWAIAYLVVYPTLKI
ncbi:hypothetical protein K502DRAFT_319343 [Neoconidiobolus thromboides FSU 785]|nr:hypothetical protein K502DRAFT_319343 [Neoconidiobolus thromboides FSU 785]